LASIFFGVCEVDILCHDDYMDLEIEEMVMMDECLGIKREKCGRK
jgi:hypothetical protein